MSLISTIMTRISIEFPELSWHTETEAHLADSCDNACFWSFSLSNSCESRRFSRPLSYQKNAIGFYNLVTVDYAQQFSSKCDTLDQTKACIARPRREVIFAMAAMSSGHLAKRRVFIRPKRPPRQLTPLSRYQLVSHIHAQ